MWILLKNEMINIDTFSSVRLVSNTMKFELVNGNIIVTFKSVENAQDGFNEIVCAVRDGEPMVDLSEFL